jgi:hypothetical protein
MSQIESGKVEKENYFIKFCVFYRFSLQSPTSPKLLTARQHTPLSTHSSSLSLSQTTFTNTDSDSE